jgi:hypothetical protein
MRRKDYMPNKDGEFDILQDNVYAAVKKNATLWLIPPQLIAELDAPRTRWNAAIAAYHNPVTRTPGITQEKNDAKVAYKSMLRTFIQGQLMRNNRVSDSDRRSLELPVYDRKPTKPLRPESRPEMDVRFPQIMWHTLHVRDSESKGKGKPPYVIGFELWRHISSIGDRSIVSFDDMQSVGLITRSPHTLKYDSANRGQMVWYASRWVNTHGELGPWSEIVSALVT